MRKFISHLSHFIIFLYKNLYPKDSQSNNKICLYFLDDFFHWGLPGESQALSRVSVYMSWKWRARKRPGRLKPFLDS